MSFIVFSVALLGKKGIRVCLLSWQYNRSFVIIPSWRENFDF